MWTGRANKVHVKPGLCLEDICNNYDLIGPALERLLIYWL